MNTTENKVNSIGMTLEQMNNKYPDDGTVYSKTFSNKHFHWVVNGKCQICNLSMNKEFEPKVKASVAKTRNCRDCGKVLQSNRYLKCTTCVPEMEQDEGNLVFHQLDGREEDDLI